MKQIALEKYTKLVKQRIQNIEKLKKELESYSSVEINNQLKDERRSLKDLLKNRFYKKVLEEERKSLINMYTRNPSLFD